MDGRAEENLWTHVGRVNCGAPRVSRAGPAGRLLPSRGERTPPPPGRRGGARLRRGERRARPDPRRLAAPRRVHRTDDRERPDPGARRRLRRRRGGARRRAGEPRLGRAPEQAPRPELGLGRRPHLVPSGRRRRDAERRRQRRDDPTAGSRASRTCSSASWARPDASASGSSGARGSSRRRIPRSTRFEVGTPGRRRLGRLVGAEGRARRRGEPHHRARDRQPSAPARAGQVAPVRRPDREARRPPPAARASVPRSGSRSTAAAARARPPIALRSRSRRPPRSSSRGRSRSARPPGSGRTRRATTSRLPSRSSGIRSGARGRPSSLRGGGRCSSRRSSMSSGLRARRSPSRAPCWRATPSAPGERASLAIRGGVEWEAWPDVLRVRGGTYFEPSRTGGAYRPHGTFGLDVRVPFWPWDLQVALAGDVARMYTNASLSIGFWSDLGPSRVGAPPPPLHVAGARAR